MLMQTLLVTVEVVQRSHMYTLTFCSCNVSEHIYYLLRTSAALYRGAVSSSNSTCMEMWLHPQCNTHSHLWQGYRGMHRNLLWGGNSGASFRMKCCLSFCTGAKLSAHTKLTRKLNFFVSSHCNPCGKITFPNSNSVMDADVSWAINSRSKLPFC